MWSPSNKESIAAPLSRFRPRGGIFPLVFLPLLLIVVAGLSAASVAYGTSPGWIQYPHGLDIIIWSRRLQWPLVALSLIACIGLVAVVISGRRRAWWLVALAPMLALFAHRFSTGPAAARLLVSENPSFVSADQSTVADDDWIVGLAFGDWVYAYPYSALFHNPVVFQADHDKRFVLIWSAYANRVLAAPISQELKAPDVEIVSTPANALLLYNSRRGEFINGLTGQTIQRQLPHGFSKSLPIPTSKMPFGQWRDLHPDTKVWARANSPGEPAPAQPIMPAWPMPPQGLERPTQTRVALIGDANPLAFDSDQLTSAPANVVADDIPILLFRSADTGAVCAFDRRLLDHQGKLDLILHFAANRRHKKFPLAYVIDEGSNTGWSADGVCVEATGDVKAMKGRRLNRVAVDDALPWGVMKFWYPDLKLEALPPAIAGEADVDDVPATRPVRRRKRKKSEVENPKAQIRN